MSATQTVHVACDTCGKREDVVMDHPNSSGKPGGWVIYHGRVDGDFCSEPCLRQKLVEKAITEARMAFDVAAPVA